MASNSAEEYSRWSQSELVDGRQARAAFGYFGSKMRLANRILDCFPPHNCWVELCCGSAALTMAKKPAYIEVINDLDGDIVNVFRQLRDRSEELIRAIEFTPYSLEEFSGALADHGNTDEMERARRFLVRAMMAVNGVLAKGRGGFSHSNSFSRGGREARVNRWVNYPVRLEAVARRLRDVRIENRDALHLLKTFSNRPASLVYIDPPYLTDRKSGYAVDAEDEGFHVKLLEQASVAQCMIAISGYDSDVYREFFGANGGWTRIDLGTYTKTTNGNRILREEQLWMNSMATEAKSGNSVPITLSSKELEDGKVNPTRGPVPLPQSLRGL